MMMNKPMSSLLAILVAFAATTLPAMVMGFAPMHQAGRMIATVPSTLRSNQVAVLGASPVDAVDYLTNSGTSAMDANALLNVVSSSVLLSETEAWVQPLSAVLGPFLNFFSFAMVSRNEVIILLREE
jgi:predicted thioredoxin/glutaredoxin